MVTQRVSAIDLGREEADDVIQALVIELETMGASKIQRDKAVGRGGLGSQADCWGEKNGWHPRQRVVAAAHLL